jgi:hypothetical protein
MQTAGLVLQHYYSSPNTLLKKGKRAALKIPITDQETLSLLANYILQIYAKLWKLMWTIKVIYQQVIQQTQVTQKGLYTSEIHL